jgi:hypothetical protein
MKVVNERVQVPVQLLSYVQEHKLVKPLSVYMYLKCMSSGKLHKSDSVFLNMPKVLGVRDKRTLNKHLATLLDLNWIGFNSQTGNYFTRGIGYIRQVHKFYKRTAVTFGIANLRDMQAFIAGGIISNNVKTQQYFWEVAKEGKLRSAIVKSGLASQDQKLTSNATTQKPDYYGLGVNKIAQLLFCSPSRASELKIEAQKAGYIRIRKKFHELCVLGKADHKLRASYAFTNPSEAKKVRFKKVKRKGAMMVAVLIQLHDEIRPKMEFKRMEKLSGS